jgi:anaerobic magnesium-protoporphyrin IX monomethyl ester cyclase
MCEIILIYPPYSYPRKNPPLGLAYIAAVLEREGYSVKIIDVSAEGFNYADIENRIRSEQPKLVGVSFMTPQTGEAFKITALVKKINPQITTVVGGPHSTAIPTEILEEKSIDFAVIGEGEITMLELADKIIRNKERELKDIKGIAYKKNNEIIITEPRPFIENLDTLPLPAWHLLPVDKYCVASTGAKSSKNVFNIFSSRGCPNQCIFCGGPKIMGRRYRRRSPKNIVQELIYLKNKFGANQFDFQDDSVTVFKDSLREMCQEIIKNNLDIIWMCNSRVDILDLETLLLMKEAGCARIDLGVESGDDNVLKRIKKGITIEQVKKAHQMAKQAGITINSFAMVGNLGEDFSSVKKTAKLMKELGEDVNVSISTPFPASELYGIAKQNNWLKVHDWNKYVTAPTSLPGYEPVMITDKMSQKEILTAWYWLHSQLMKKKFQTRFGRFFLLNPKFYQDAPFRARNFKELIHKIKMGYRLIVSSFKK